MGVWIDMEYICVIMIMASKLRKGYRAWRKEISKYMIICDACDNMMSLWVLSCMTCVSW